MKKIWAPGCLKTHDVDASCPEGSGVFGLTSGYDESRVTLIPVPYDGTASKGKGTAGAPAAIFRESKQVELYSPKYGEFWRQGIHMTNMPPDPLDLLDWRAIVEGVTHASLHHRVYVRCKEVAEQGHIVGLVGGEHSVSFGNIRACAEKHPGMIVIHVDAHADLREAYDGEEWSHASIMRNVIEKIPQVSRVISVGVRAYGMREYAYLAEKREKVSWWKPGDLERFLPALRRGYNEIYFSLDIDGLTPENCPHTGTPEPGGLSYDDVVTMVHLCSDNRWSSIVGFDLVEVGDHPWDAYVGAKLLYELCGAAVTSQKKEDA